MITISKRASEEIMLSKLNPDNEDLLIRFAVEQTESGFHYLMGFDQRHDDDIHLRSNGVEYIVAYAQKSLLEGMLVDFDQIDTQNGYGFVFMNPNDPDYTPPTPDFAPKK